MAECQGFFWMAKRGWVICRRLIRTLLTIIFIIRFLVRRFAVCPAPFLSTGAFATPLFQKSSKFFNFLLILCHQRVFGVLVHLQKSWNVRRMSYLSFVTQLQMCTIIHHQKLLFSFSPLNKTIAQTNTQGRDSPSSTITVFFTSKVFHWESTS